VVELHIELAPPHSSTVGRLPWDMDAHAERKSEHIAVEYFRLPDIPLRLTRSAKRIFIFAGRPQRSDTSNCWAFKRDSTTPGSVTTTLSWVAL